MIVPAAKAPTRRVGRICPSSRIHLHLGEHGAVRVHGIGLLRKRISAGAAVPLDLGEAGAAQDVGIALAAAFVGVAAVEASATRQHTDIAGPEQRRALVAHGQFRELPSARNTRRPGPGFRTSPAWHSTASHPPRSRPWPSEGPRGWRLDKPLPPFAIPATLQDSLAARLDRLAPVKAIAQIDAAIGREFSYPLLRAVAGATSRHCARHWRSSRRRSCCSARACRPMRATPSSMRWSRTPRTKPCSGAGGRSCKQPKQSGPAWRETPPQF